MPAPQRLVIKILCPDIACGSFIGEKGCNVREIERATDTLIEISRKRNFYPGTEQRVISIAGFTLDSMYDVIVKIIDAVDKYNDKSYAKCFLVTSADGAGCLLGNGGERIYNISSRYNKLNINLQNRAEMDKTLKERYVEITSHPGIVDDVKSCARRIMSIVCHKNVEQPFQPAKYPESKVSPKKTEDDFWRVSSKKTEDDFWRVSSKKTEDDFWRVSSKKTEDDFGRVSSKKREDDFGRMQNQWEELMKPVKKGLSNIEARGEARLLGEARLQPRKDDHNIECTQIKGDRVMNLVKGEWVVSDTYTVFEVKKDFNGDIMFRRVS